MLLGTTFIRTCFLATLVTLASVNGALAQFTESTFLFLWTSGPDNTHREMVVKSPLDFTDKSGRVWHVPLETVIDGASIPSWLWSFAGSPYVGTYRRASVFHDHYCDLQSEPANLVHKMFRDVMYFDNTPWWEAESKYLAVAAFDVAATAVGGGCGINESAADQLTELRRRAEVATMDAALTDELLSIAVDYMNSLPESMDELEARKNQIAELAGLQDARLYSVLVDYRFRPGMATYQRIEPTVLVTESSGLRTELAVELARATTPQGEPVEADCACVDTALR